MDARMVYICELVYVMHHMNTMKVQNHMILSIGAEKILAKSNICL